MGKLAEIWKTNPAVRMVARTAVAGVAGYLAVVIQQGGSDWKSILSGAAGAAIYAVVGLATPVEPKVGVNKVAIK